VTAQNYRMAMCEVRFVFWSVDVAKNQNGQLILNLKTLCLTVYDTRENFHCYLYIKWSLLCSLGLTIGSVVQLTAKVYIVRFF
jgi:hypothetical protein